jgi:hypothetical protein
MINERHAPEKEGSEKLVAGSGRNWVHWAGELGDFVGERFLFFFGVVGRALELRRVTLWAGVEKTLGVSPAVEADEGSF